MMRPYCFGLPERSHIWHRDPEEYPNGWCDSCDHFVDCQGASKTPPSILTLHLKEQYFGQITAGMKKDEYREATHYNRQRLQGKTFDVIEICNAYPPREDIENRLWFCFDSIKLVLMRWENEDKFVKGPTFIISLRGKRLDYPYQAMEET
jgi:hypothetical protein